MDLQLHRITRLVRDHHAILPWKAIHIAGTNGKGTTAAFLSAFLHKKGLKVGRFNSPHLRYRHDCIVLNEKTVDKDLFLEVEKIVKRRDQDAKLGSTSFELLTATAFELFARHKVDVAVVECGIGGRLDATNVLLPEEVICCAITRISLDHQDMLGDSIEKIAAEKAGIIKQGVPVIVDQHNSKAVLAVIKERAASTNSSLFLSHQHEPPLSELNDTSLPAGTSSQDNLAIAVKVYNALVQSRNFNLSPLTGEELQQSVHDVSETWGGRLQWTNMTRIAKDNNQKRICLIDGAHNSEGAARLRQYVDEQLKLNDRPVWWVIGMSSGKKVDEIMLQLVRSGDHVAVTEFDAVDGMPWVKPHRVDDLRRFASDYSNGTVTAEADPIAALRTVFATAPSDALIVVAGSLYLVGHVLRELDSLPAAPTP